MPLSDDGKEPIIKERSIRLDSAKGQKLLINETEATRRIIEEGAKGFALYAGKESHNTDNLVFADHDDIDKFPLDTLPDTLTVVSGSGEGYHETFINDGSVRNSNGSGDMSGVGEIRASNWYIVTPGSIHPSGGIYHTVTKRELATLSNDLIPPGLVKNTYSSTGSGSEVDEEKLEDLAVDDDDVSIARQHLNEWKSDHLSAFFCLLDRLKGGRGDYGRELDKNHGSKIDRDKQEKTILTHLYGIYREFGYSKSRSKELAYQFLSYYSRELPYMKDGQARKWINRNATYKQRQIQYAAEQFDIDDFRRFKNKSTKTTTRKKKWDNEYSDVTRGMCLFVVDLMSGVYAEYDPEDIHEFALDEYGFSISSDELKGLVGLVGHLADKQCVPLYNDMRGPSPNGDTLHKDLYPKKSQVSEICERLDGVYKGNTKKSFDECLSKLQREGRLKVACMKQGEDYRVYPADFNDPQKGEWIRYKGIELKPGESIPEPEKGEI